jgi:hypothetical protein
MYVCNGLIANWLITNAKLPLMARNGRDFMFAKTEALEGVLKKIPWWMKVPVKF